MNNTRLLFLTHGSACQDCGFNNQRWDLQCAIALAQVTKRVLVVRNLVCSPHNIRCPRISTASDGILAVYGGAADWRARCNAIGNVPCDVNKASLKRQISFLPAKAFFSEEYLRQQLGRDGFMWTDDFERDFAWLHGKSFKKEWVMINRRKKLHVAELRARVWHAQDLHNGKNLLARNAAPAWSPYACRRKPIAYAEWLRAIARAILHRIGAENLHACAHVRLGDFNWQHGLHDDKFQLQMLAKHVHRTIVRLRSRLTWSTVPSRPNLFLATYQKNLTTVANALGARYRVLTLTSLNYENMSRYAHPLHRELLSLEDARMCIEQLVCSRMDVFLGTRGSTVTEHILSLRTQANMSPDRSAVMRMSHFFRS